MLFRRRTQESEAGGVAVAEPATEARPEGGIARRRFARRRATGRSPADGRYDDEDGRRPRAGASRMAWSAGAVGAIGGFALLIGRVIRFAAIVVALIIAAAIVLRVLGANSGNTIVSALHDAGKALVGPFDGMFKVSGAKATMALNWGIALVVYLVAGSMLASVFSRMAIGPRRRARRLRTRAA